MDIRNIEETAAFYKQHSDEETAEQLDFFLPIWRTVDALEREIQPDSDLDLPTLYAWAGESENPAMATGQPMIIAASKAEPIAFDEWKSSIDIGSLKSLYAMNFPYLYGHPVYIDPGLLAEELEGVSSAFADSGFYSDETAEALRGIDWKRVVEVSDAAMAGNNPMNWLTEVVESLALPDDVLPVAAVISTLALRAQLEPYANVIRAVQGYKKEKPVGLRCPVCGFPPTLSAVEDEDSSVGHTGRSLYCSQCGSSWQFERDMCARCGNPDPETLEYREKEGDEAHKLQVCKCCGGTTRTVFVDKTDAPYAPEVEDVVMSGLEALA